MEECMKTIPLTRGLVSIVDDDDYEMLIRYKWYAKIKKNGKYIYAARARWENKTRQTTLMHRVILNPPPRMEIDHIDGNGLNNQRSNIRIVTRRQNGQNRHYRN
jgi:hypothetical protein